MQLFSQQITSDWILFTMINNHGMKVEILNYGGIITKIVVPDRQGKLENVVLAYKHLEDYKANPYYFGSIIGRTAGRIRNAAFTIDGKKYKLDPNEGKHHLHGGKQNFSHVVWDATTEQTKEMTQVKLSRTSPNGESGYPGTVHATVSYQLTNDNELIIEFGAQSDEDTILTMTNHTYFNLSGNLTSTIHDHYVTITSDKVAEVNEECIPTGKWMCLAGTPFDFRNGRKLRDGLQGTHRQNKIVGNGYDHYFQFPENASDQVHVFDPSSGRSLSIHTNQPGMVMYTSNFLEAGLSLSGRKSTKHLGVCFETQGTPASLEHDHFPPILLKAGEPYDKKTIFRFATDP